MISFRLQFHKPAAWAQTPIHIEHAERSGTKCVESSHNHRCETNERSLEVKLPTIWTDGRAEVGRVREEKVTRKKFRGKSRGGKRRESEKEEDQREKQRWEEKRK